MEMTFRSPKGSATVRRTRSARRSRGGRAPLFAALAVVPLLAGCAANFDAQTQVQYQPAVGSDNRATDIYVLNALVVGDDSGDGTVVGTLINQADCPDYLVAVQAVDNSGGGIETSPLPAVQAVQSSTCAASQAPDTGIALPSQRPAKLPDDGQVQVHADTVAPGTFITLTLRFQQAGPIEIDVPVVAEAAMYDGITVGPIETPTGEAATTTPSN